MSKEKEWYYQIVHGQGIVYNKPLCVEIAENALHKLNAKHGEAIAKFKKDYCGRLDFDTAHELNGYLHALEVEGLLSELESSAIYDCITKEWTPKGECK